MLGKKRFSSNRKRKTISVLLTQWVGQRSKEWLRNEIKDPPSQRKWVRYKISGKWQCISERLQRDTQRSWERSDFQSELILLCWTSPLPTSSTFWCKFGNTVYMLQENISTLKESFVFLSNAVNQSYAALKTAAAAAMWKSVNKRTYAYVLVTDEVSLSPCCDRGQCEKLEKTH